MYNNRYFFIFRHTTCTLNAIGQMAYRKYISTMALPIFRFVLQ